MLPNTTLKITIFTGKKDWGWEVSTTMYFPTRILVATFFLTFNFKKRKIMPYISTDFMPDGICISYQISSSRQQQPFFILSKFIFVSISTVKMNAASSSDLPCSSLYHPSSWSTIHKDMPTKQPCGWNCRFLLAEQVPDTAYPMPWRDRQTANALGKHTSLRKILPSQLKDSPSRINP